MRKNLKNTRKREKLTQNEIARRLNISERHYRALESGFSNGSIKTWEQLKDLFNESIDFLLKKD